jgi:hypothetical protein
MALTHFYESYSPCSIFDNAKTSSIRSNLLIKNQKRLQLMLLILICSSANGFTVATTDTGTRHSETFMRLLTALCKQ